MALTPELLATIASHAHPEAPLPIVLAQAEHESDFDATKRGAAGEWGLFQLLPATVRGGDIGYMGPLEALADPALNTALATAYLVKLFHRFGTWPLAIAHYNGSGPSARAYSVAILQLLPKWSDYVRANLEAIGKAVVGRGSGAIALVVLVAGAVWVFTKWIGSHE